MIEILLVLILLAITHTFTLAFYAFVIFCVIVWIIKILCWIVNFIFDLIPD